MTNNTFEVGQEVQVIANPVDKLFQMLSGQTTGMHGLKVGDVTTIAEIDEDGDIFLVTEGFEFDREIFHDGNHRVEAGWIEAV